MRHRGAGREAGASLLIVLILVSLLALFIGAIGMQGVVGSKSGVAARDQRRSVFGAKNAINAAINHLRANPTAGREGVPCLPPSPAPFTYGSPGGNVTVSCQPLAGSGQPQGGDSFPGYALLTMDPTRPGIDVSGNATFGIDGAAWSNSTINVGNSLEFAAGDDLVGATGTCTYGNASSKITATPLMCPPALAAPSGISVPDPGGVGDPAPGSCPGSQASCWASSVTTIPVHQVIPACTDLSRYNPTTHVMRLDPGFYDDATALSTMTSPTGCGGPVIVWLTPGAYYFELSAANTLWTISGGYVIGGTPSGWDPASATVDQRTVLDASFTSRAASNTTGPATCNRSAAGVELVFGGESHIKLASPGRVELCPSPSASGQQTVIYGRKAGSTTTQTYQPSGVTCSPLAVVCSPPAPLLQIEDTGTASTVASYTVTDPDATQRFTFTGYDLNAIPAGSIINSLKVRVGHQEGSSGSWLLSAAVKIDGSDVCSPVNIPIGADAGGEVATVPCATGLAWAGPAPVSVTYNVRRSAVNGCNGNNGNCKETLDGVELLVTYTAPPGLQAQSGCVTATSSPCPFLDVDNTGGSNQAALYAWGTLYTPKGGLTANFKNKSQFLFGRGAVVRWFAGTDIPSAQLFDAFSVGTQYPYANRRIELVAQIDGVRKLRAQVEFQDFATTAGTVPAVTIWHWSAVN